MRVTEGGALDTPCHWGGARVEALVAIRLAGMWSKREKRPPKTCKNFKQKRLFNPKMFFQITCFMIGYVLTQPVRFAHVVVKG